MQAREPPGQDNLKEALDRLALQIVAFQAGLLRLSRLSADGGRMSFSGGLRPDRGNCGAFAPYFLIFPFLCLLRPGVEAVKRVFKGVQFVHFTLGSGRPQGSPLP